MLNNVNILAKFSKEITNKLLEKKQEKNIRLWTLIKGKKNIRWCNAFFSLASLCFLKKAYLIYAVTFES